MTFDFFTQADSTEKLFWIFAVSGTLFFALRVVLMLVAGADTGDAEGLDDVETLEDTDVSFQLISIHSVTGFIMMFGWVGLATYKDHGLPAVQAILAAFAGGAVTMFLTAHLFRMMIKLTSRGARFSIQRTLGSNATVYVKIPAEGRGQVQLTHQGSTRTLDAVSEDKVELESFAGVSVTKIVDARTVSVRKL